MHDHGCVGGTSSLVDLTGKWQIKEQSANIILVLPFDSKWLHWMKVKYVLQIYLCHQGAHS